MSSVIIGKELLDKFNIPNPWEAIEKIPGVPNISGGIQDAGSTIYLYRKPTLNYLSRVVADTYLNINTKCVSQLKSAQYMNLLCQPSGSPAEESAACKSCLELVGLDGQLAFDIQRQQWSKGSKPEVLKPINTQFQEFTAAIESCALSCKSCVFSDNSQFASIKITQNCEAANDFREQIINSVTSKVSNDLFQKNDVLSSLEKSLRLTGSSQNAVVVNYTNRVKSSINEMFDQGVFTSLNVTQTMQISSLSSLYFSGSNQSFAIDQISKALLNAGFGDNLLTTEEWDETSQVYIDNSTLNAAGDLYVSYVNSLSSIINTAIGGIMFAILIIAGVLTLVLIGLFIFKAIKGEV